MATELERLLVRIDATTEGLRREIKKSETSVDGLGRRIERNQRKINRSFDSIGKSARSLATTLIAAFSVRAFVQAAKEMENLEARLKTITGSARAATQAMTLLRQISHEQSVELTALADGFNRLLPAVKAGRLSFDEMQQVLVLANDNLRAFGLNAGDARGLFIGLSQAFGSGTVQMEDLRQVTDRLPGSLDAIARALKTDVAGLKELVATGEFTAEQLKGPLIEAFRLNEGAAKDLADTFEAGMTRMKNAFGDFSDAIADIGVLDAITFAVEKLSNAMNFLSALTRKASLTFAELTGNNEKIIAATIRYEQALDKLAPTQEANINELEKLEGVATAGAEGVEKLTKAEKKARDEKKKLQEKQEEYNKELMRSVKQLDLLLKANVKSEDSHKRLKIEIDAENEARKQGFELGTKEFEQITALIKKREELKQGITDTTQARKDAIEKAKEEQQVVAEALLQPWQNAFENVQDELANMLVEGKFNFESLADIAKRLAAEVAAAWVIRPILQATISGSFTGGGGGGLLGGLLGGGGGAASGGGGLGGFGLTDILGFGSKLLPTGISSALNAFGASTFGGIFSGTQAAAAASGIIGPPTAAASGAAATLPLASLALPLAGLAIPLLLGGLFSGPRPHPASNFESRIGEEGLGGVKLTSKHIDTETGRTLSEAVDGIAQTLLAAGLEVAGIRIQGGVDDSRGFFTIGDVSYKENFDNPLTTVRFDPAGGEAATSQGLGELALLLAKNAENAEEYADALSRVETEGRKAEEVLSDINFILNFDDLGDAPEILTAVEAQIRELTKVFDEAAETAERLGLEVEKVRQAEERQLNAIKFAQTANIAQQILGIAAPGELSRIQEEQRFSQQIKELRLLGATKEEIQHAELLHALKMEEVANDNARAINGLSSASTRLGNTLSNFLFDITHGRFSPLAPRTNLDEIRNRVLELGALSDAGDVAAREELAGLLPAFVELSAEVNGFNKNFEQDRQIAEDLTRKAISIEEQLLSATTAGFAGLEAAIERLGLDITTSSLLGAANFDPRLLRADETPAKLGKVGGSKLDLATERRIKLGFGFDFSAKENQQRLFRDFIPEELKDAYREAVRAAGGVPEFNTGGLVSGAKGVDSILARLTDGEFVVRANAVRSIGQANLERMNASGMISNDNVAGKIDMLINSVDRLTRVATASGTVTNEALGAIAEEVSSLSRDARLVASS